MAWKRRGRRCRPSSRPPSQTRPPASTTTERGCSSMPCATGRPTPTAGPRPSPSTAMRRRPAPPSGSLRCASAPSPPPAPSHSSRGRRRRAAPTAGAEARPAGASTPGGRRRRCAVSTRTRSIPMSWAPHSTTCAGTGGTPPSPTPGGRCASPSKTRSTVSPGLSRPPTRSDQRGDPPPAFRRRFVASTGTPRRRFGFACDSPASVLRRVGVGPGLATALAAATRGLDRRHSLVGGVSLGGGLSPSPVPARPVAIVDVAGLITAGGGRYPRGPGGRRPEEGELTGPAPVEPLAELPGREGWAHDETLGQVASQLGEQVPRVAGLDALGHGDQPEVAAQGEHRAGDGAVALVDGHAGNERLVDLDLADRKPAQVCQRRVTRAEVVARQADAEVGQTGEHVDRSRR